MTDNEKILLGLILALLALLWGINQYEIRSLRKSLHDLREKLPEIIKQWIEWFKGKDSK